MTRKLLYLILLLFHPLLMHAESNYEHAVKTGVYKVESSEFIGFPDNEPFSQLRKNEGVTYERDPSELLHARTQSVLAERLNQYSQNKEINIHTVVYESKTLKYKAIYEGDNISVTATYKDSNQVHSKIWFYKPSMLSISSALEKNQAIMTYWQSGKLQSKEYFCSGVPVGFSQYFIEDGKLYGVIDWTQSDYELPTNKLYKSTNQSRKLLLAGKIYLNDGNSLVLAEKLSTLGPNERHPLSLDELDAIPFADIYQRHKLGLQYQRPLDKYTELVMKCPWLDEAMSYSKENQQFALPAPEPLTIVGLKKDTRDLYDDCIFNPSADCLSHFAFEQTKNDTDATSFYSVRRLLTALGKTNEFEKLIEIWAPKWGGSVPSINETERLRNKHSESFLSARKKISEELQQAQQKNDLKAQVSTLRNPVYVEPLNINLSQVDGIDHHEHGSDVETYLLALVSAAEVYADTQQPEKANTLLKLAEQNMPPQKLKGSNIELERVNNIRAEMAITYSRLGMADWAEKQLTLIDYSDPNRSYDTSSFAAYGWTNSALQLCRQGNLQRGKDFLSMWLSMQENNRLQISEVTKQAIDECKYAFDLKRAVGSNYNYPSTPDGFAGYPQMWSSYDLYFKRGLPTQPIDYIEKQKRESEAVDGTNISWIYQNYYSQKINTLFASGRVVEAKKVADEYERFVQAGSWYKFAPTIYTKVGRLRAKYGDCKGALNSFNNAVLSLQLNKMNIDNSFVIRHPHYTLLPFISQGMAHCGASLEDLQKLQIDFDFSAPAETIKNNRRADEIEIEMAMNKASSDVKSATEIVSKLTPTDLKINALVAIARQNPKNQVSMKTMLIKELNGFNQYFGIQLGAKEQRRAIGGFLQVLDMYFDKSDNKLSRYLTELGKQAEVIPQDQFKARALCQLGYLADKKQVVLDKSYFDLGIYISKNLSWSYGAPAGSCAYWLKKAGHTQEAESLLNTNMATFRAYKTDPNNPKNWRKYAEGPDLAIAAFVYWEYEHGEMPSKYDETISYYQDSRGLIQAY